VDVQITCPCPGSPHAQDTVTLRDRLTFAGGLAVRQRIADAVRSRLGEDDIVATMTEGYILHGISAWTLVGDDGKPLPLTLANIRRIFLDDFSDLAMPLAEVANELYETQVIDPLVKAASSSSPDSPTSESTSPTSEDTPKPKATRSRRSSTSTTPTADTATTTGPLNGVSSFSPSSVSASG
jgi:hypothetical protein